MHFLPIFFHQKSFILRTISFIIKSVVKKMWVEKILRYTLPKLWLKAKANWTQSREEPGLLILIKLLFNWLGIESILKFNEAIVHEYYAYFNFNDDRHQLQVWNADTVHYISHTRFHARTWTKVKEGRSWIASVSSQTPLTEKKLKQKNYKIGLAIFLIWTIFSYVL